MTHHRDTRWYSVREILVSIRAHVEFIGIYQLVILSTFYLEATMKRNHTISSVFLGTIITPCKEFM